MIVVAIRYGRRDRYCKCGPADCQNQSYQSLCRRIFLSEQFLSLPCGVLRHVFPISRSRFPSGKVCGPNDRVQFLHLAANQAKRRGRQIKMRPDWEDRKLTIMHNLLVHKFNENLELIPKLLDTGGAVLVEGNTWHDNYWGCCSCPGAEQLRTEQSGTPADAAARRLYGVYREVSKDAVLYDNGADQAHSRFLRL